MVGRGHVAKGDNRRDGNHMSNKCKAATRAEKNREGGGGNKRIEYDSCRACEISESDDRKSPQNAVQDITPVAERQVGREAQVDSWTIIKLERSDVLLHQGRGKEVIDFLSQEQQIDQLVPVRGGRDFRVWEEEVCFICGGIVVRLDDSLVLHDTDDHCSLGKFSDHPAGHSGSGSWRDQSRRGDESGGLKRRRVVKEDDIVIREELSAPTGIRVDRRQNFLMGGIGHAN